MSEWFRESYTEIIINNKILLGSTGVACSTLDFLKIFFTILLSFYVFKIMINSVVIYKLKRRFAPLNSKSNIRISKIFAASVKKVGLRRIPDLHRFDNLNPLVFTVGVFKPGIFLTPELANQLPDEELEAAFIHELNHIKRYDNLRHWLLELFVVFLPVFIIQYTAIHFVFSLQNSLYATWGTIIAVVIFKALVFKRIVHWKELSCDDQSIKYLKDPLILAASILSVWQYGKEKSRFRWSSFASIQTFIPTTGNPLVRIDRLINYKNSRCSYILREAFQYAFISMFVVGAFFIGKSYFSREHFDIGAANHACKLGCTSCTVNIDN